MRTSRYCFWVDGIGLASTRLAIVKEATAISAVSDAADTTAAPVRARTHFHENIRVPWLICNPLEKAADTARRGGSGCANDNRFADYRALSG